MARTRSPKTKNNVKKNNLNLSKDITALILVFLAVICFLSLVSFSPGDPTLFNSSVVSRMISDNLMGNTGAHVSAVLMHFTGYASFLLPVFLIIMAITLFMNDSFKLFYVQLPVFLLEMIVLSVFFSVIFEDFVFISSDIPLAYESAGGVIGEILKGLLLPAFNFWGTILILIFLLCALFMVGARLGLNSMLGGLIKSLNVFFSVIKNTLIKIKNEFATRRKARKIKKEIQEEKQIKSRIKEKIISGEMPPIEEPMVWETSDEEEEEGMSTLDIALHTGLNVEDGRPYAPPWREIFVDADPASRIDKKELGRKADLIVKKFAEFDIQGQVVNIHPGPVVTTYEFKMAPGIKYNKVVGLAQDMCIALSAESVRIDKMFKKPTVGIEVPNDTRKLIVLKEILETREYMSSTNPLTIALGQTITGQPYITSLSKMPHLLIAGQTGSGKSVGLNAIICSILVSNSPEKVKMIMVDPKMVELGIYSDIPHLLTDVIIDPKEAASALTWAVAEMERRYNLLKNLKVRNLENYNTVVDSGMADDSYEKLPYIVVIIDEMADLIMTARAQVEESIARLAQKARAVGVCLILATQRPSRDIITGVIKSNLPSKISYRVAQMMDSRIILDRPGAEQLLGKGDMLFIEAGSSSLRRLHSPLIVENEINQLVDYLKEYGKPIYQGEIKSFGSDDDDGGISSSAVSSGLLSTDDPEYIKAVKLIVATGQASVSYLQRKFSIGYNKAARFIDIMEQDGIVGPPAKQSGKPREVLVDSDFIRQLEEG